MSELRILRRQYVEETHIGARRGRLHVWRHLKGVQHFCAIGRVVQGYGEREHGILLYLVYDAQRSENFKGSWLYEVR